MGGNGWEGWWRGMVNFWIGDTAAFEGWRTDFWRWHLLSTRGELSDLIELSGLIGSCSAGVFCILPIPILRMMRLTSRNPHSDHFYV